MPSSILYHAEGTSGPRDTPRSLILPDATSYTQPWTQRGLPAAHARLTGSASQMCSTWRLTFSRTMRSRAVDSGVLDRLRLAARLVSGVSQRERGVAAGFEPASAA